MSPRIPLPKSQANIQHSMTAFSHIPALFPLPLFLLVVSELGRRHRSHYVFQADLDLKILWPQSLNAGIKGMQRHA